MIKSYSYQKNRNNRPQKPSNLVLKLPVVLPEDIDEHLECEIYDLLTNTEFDKIPVLVYVKAADIGLDTSTNRGPSYIKVGYLKKFTVHEDGNVMTGYFDASIYNSRNSDSIKKFYNPVIEIEYNDYNNNKLLNIVRFNIIDYARTSISEYKMEKKVKPVDDVAPEVTTTNNPEQTVIKAQNSNNDVEYINEDAHERLSSPIGDIIGNK